MWPFDKEKPKRSKASSEEPGKKVSLMSSEGMSEQEIVKRMREEGYSDSDIDEGMKESIKSAVGPSSRRDMLPPKEMFSNQRPSSDDSAIPAPSAPMNEAASEPPSPTAPSAPEERAGAPIQPPMPPQRSGAGPPFSFDDFSSIQRGTRPPETPASEPIDFSEEMSVGDLESDSDTKELSRRETEEVVESVVEDKWNQARNELETIRMSVDSLDSRVSSLEQSIDDIKKEKRSEVQQIDKKIDTYKESMSEVSARMEAMESALKDSLTPMMQSMRSLNDTVKDLKKK